MGTSDDAGRCLLIGLPGTEIDPSTEATIRRLSPAGVVLFSRNLESPGQTRRLLERFTALITHPALLAIDQEGGRVSRLLPWIGATPAAAELARRGPDAVTRFGRITAGLLRNLGFNLDFAPVVDLSPADAPNGIGDRAFDRSAELVTEMAGAFLDALQQAGVAGCLKHFPGLGATRVDSHRVLPIDPRPRTAFERADLVPFRRLADRAACIMVGHGHYPELDSQAARPASCSPPVIRGLLIDWIGYRGLVVSDDMEMGAIRERDVEGSAAVEALDAGCDLLLYCQGLARAEAAAEALTREAERSAAFRRRLQEAGGRVQALARRWPVAPGDESNWNSLTAALPRPTGRQEA